MAPKRRPYKSYLVDCSDSKIPRTTRRRVEGTGQLPSEDRPSTSGSVEQQMSVLDDELVDDYLLDDTPDNGPSDDESSGDESSGNESSSSNSDLDPEPPGGGPPDDDPPGDNPDPLNPPNPPANAPPPPDEYNLDGPAFLGTPLTKFEVLILIIHYVIRFSLSDVALKALLQLVNTVLGVAIIPPSNYIFKKIFKQTFRKSITLYCPKCFYNLGKKEECDLNSCPSCDEPVGTPESNNNGNYYINISLEDQIRHLLEGPEGERIFSYRLNRERNEEYISDVFDGMLFEKLLETVPEGQSFITLTLNTDGAAVFKSSKNALWPIQAHINELPPEERFATYNLLVASLWFGNPEISMTTWMSHFVEEAQRLADEGVRWYRAATGTYEVTKVFFCFASIDVVAKAKVLNIHAHNGKKSCYMCTHEGDMLGQSCRYGHRENYERRTAASIEHDMLQAHETNQIVNGFKGISPLIHLPSFSLPFAVVIDYMHSHLLGLCKYLVLNIWCNSALNGEDFYLGPAKQHQINKRLMALHTPSDISRDRRSLFQCANWKANEWRAWLFYYAPMCLKDILPQRYYNHFCLLSASLFFFTQRSIEKVKIGTYGGYLALFVRQYEEYYGLIHCTHNLHLTVHIKECVVSCGPLWAYSTFPFESGNGYLVKLIQGPMGVVQQIANKFCTYASIPKVVAYHPPLNDIVGDFCDKILSLRRFKFAAHCEGGITIVGDKFRSRFHPNNDELLAMANVIPNFVNDADVSFYFIKKIILQRRIYKSWPTKLSYRRNDSFALLHNNEFMKILKFFVTSLNPNQLYFIGQKVQVNDDQRRTFTVNDFHLKVCEAYPFAQGVRIIPAEQIKQKCFFIDAHPTVKVICRIPPMFERD